MKAPIDMQDVLSKVAGIRIEDGLNGYVKYVKDKYEIGNDQMAILDKAISDCRGKCRKPAQLIELDPVAFIKSISR